MKDKELILQAIAKMEEAIAELKALIPQNEVHTENSTTPTTPPTGEHPGRP